MVNNFKTGRTKITSNEVSDMKVRVYGNTAVITGKADVAGTMAGKDTKGQIMFTRVYVKKGGSWQSVAFQQTLVPTPLDSYGPRAMAALGPNFPCRSPSDSASPNPRENQPSKSIRTVSSRVPSKRTTRAFAALLGN